MKTTCSLILSLLLSTPLVAFGSDTDEFLYQVCLHGMITQSTVPRDESELFCACTSGEIVKNLTRQQRASIEEMLSRVRSGKKPQHDKSGLSELTRKSEDVCAAAMWPTQPKISDQDHKKYSAMANKSVDEFNAIINDHCEQHHDVDKRRKCFASASREWLREKGKQYASIPDIYITGNSLASIMIEDDE